MTVSAFTCLFRQEIYLRVSYQKKESMTFQLNAAPRTAKPEVVRAAGNIPGVVYGPEFKSESITLPSGEFLKVLGSAGETTLIDCVIAGHKDPVTVLIQDVERDPVRGNIIHVDLRQVNMSQEIEADIELTFVGEAPAVKGFNGVLVKIMDTLKVRCLPKVLVSHIDVALDKLKTFEDAITVADIVVPSGMKVLDHAPEVVAKVQPERSEAELAALDEKPVVADLESIEVVKKPKAEEGEEGAESAEGETKAPKAKANE